MFCSFFQNKLQSTNQKKTTVIQVLRKHIDFMGSVHQSRGKTTRETGTQIQAATLAQPASSDSFVLVSDDPDLDDFVVIELPAGWEASGSELEPQATERSPTDPPENQEHPEPDPDTASTGSRGEAVSGSSFEMEFDSDMRVTGDRSCCWDYCRVKSRCSIS